MQTREGLCRSHDFVGGRLGSVEGSMLVLLHGLLLSSVVSEVCIRIDRVSQLKEKIMKLFHGSEDDYRSASKCNCSVAAFSRPLSRCFLFLYRAPRLHLWCAEETSSAQGCICVPSLHLQTRRREEASKGRGAGGDHTHPQALLAFRTSSYLSRRKRTCPLTLLAVHAASGHEA
jgi:hypothetical protein